MVRTPIKLLRYNTGNDKKAFVRFKKDFDAVIFNATIVAYSGSSIADLVSVHKNQYIIDPQTYIFQHSISAIQNKEKSGIKKSVIKYLEQLPCELRTAIESGTDLTFSFIDSMMDELVQSVYKFQVDFVDQFLSEKEYDKYLKYAEVSGPQPMFVIAPYFMLKKGYSNEEISSWMRLNKNSFLKTKQISANETIASQIVIDKDLLMNDYFFIEVKKMFEDIPETYVFLWIDDFDSFSCGDEYQNGYKRLLELFYECNVYPVMAYGGYDSIVLCNNHIKHKLYGAAQSVGYGEKRQITPVGGGLPVNKYYFLPLHSRLKFGDAAQILRDNGYFDSSESNKQHSINYYSNICNCKQCREVIKSDIDNFVVYNESVPFSINSKNGPVNRNRPTTYASFISAIHFLNCKVNEWESIINKDKDQLADDLRESYRKYLPMQFGTIDNWCKKYVD